MIGNIKQTQPNPTSTPLYPSLPYSGTKFRQMLRAGEDIPTWFAFESVVKVLRAEAQAAPA